MSANAYPAHYACESDRFIASHALTGTVWGEEKEQTHEHIYWFKVEVGGETDPHTGMSIDNGILTEIIAALETRLNSKNLNDIEDMGAPTLENISRWLWRHINPKLPRNIDYLKVTMHRMDNKDEGSYDTFDEWKVTPPKMPRLRGRTAPHLV
jgi:6-pyruvoyltetrahydropterin/6-carboxytetrahydropterin synthase